MDSAGCICGARWRNKALSGLSLKPRQLQMEKGGSTDQLCIHHAFGKNSSANDTRVSFRSLLAPYRFKEHIMDGEVLKGGGPDG